MVDQCVATHLEEQIKRIKEEKLIIIMIQPILSS